MEKKVKDRTLVFILIIAVFQGPLLYYFFDGFFKLIFFILFGLTGFILSFFHSLDLIRHKSTTKWCHFIALAVAFAIGLFTIRGHLIEYLDFNLRKTQRNEIVEEIKKTKLKEGEFIDDSFLPISQGGKIKIKSNVNGVTSVEFYIDPGFIDHYAAFLYTNDPYELNELAVGTSTYQKLDNNWYRVSY